MDCHTLLQGILPIQGSNPGLLNWQAGSLPLLQAQKGLQEITNEVWKERQDITIGGWIKGSSYYIKFSNYNGEYRLPLVLAQGSPIIHSSCEGELGIALE